MIWWIWSFFMIFNAHDFHVSRMVMDYDDENQRYEVQLHIFTDDLELGLERQGNADLFLNTKREHPKADAMILEYIRSAIHLESKDGSSGNIRWLGKEPSDDLMATWIYFYLEPPQGVAHCILRNRLLLEVYDDQQNIVKISGPASDGYWLLRGSKNEITFQCPAE